MSTNKIVMREVDSFMSDYTPAYVPLLPLFIAANSVQYAEQVGNVSFNRLEAVGDLRSKLLGPKDTEIHQIGAKEGKKKFSKYFFGSQYHQSQLQDTQGYEDVVAQVLDEHNRQSDELFLTGEGTSSTPGPTAPINNGLYWSLDPNYTSNASVEVAKAADGSHIAALYSLVSGMIQTAQETDGQILVLYYGTNTSTKWTSLFAATSKPFGATMQEAFGDVNFAKLPTAITPAGAEGFLVINLGQVKLHYTTLPKVDDQGTNAEKKYVWTNFLMGSSMLEVLSKNGVIKQPVTYAA